MSSGGLVKRIDLERHHVIRIGEDVVVTLRYDSARIIKATVNAPRDKKIVVEEQP